MLKVQEKEAREVLETIAVQHAADKSMQGSQHMSRLARLTPGSWQAEVIRNAPSARTAMNATELRELMGDPDVAVIFLPHKAAVNAGIIERICSESSLNKMIIWEADA